MDQPGDLLKLICPAWEQIIPFLSPTNSLFMEVMPADNKVWLPTLFVP